MATRATDWLPLTVRVADCAPVEVGWKVGEMVQVAPGSRGVEVHVLVKANAVPDGVMVEIGSVIVRG